MPKRSAGLLMCRLSGGHLEVLLGHPGGPLWMKLWMKKDLGAWTIPKGEYAAGEKPYPTRAALGPGSWPPHEVDHHRNEGDNQEQVNKPPSGVKCKPTKSP
jgi:hypothetical protein